MRRAKREKSRNVGLLQEVLHSPFQIAYGCGVDLDLAESEGACGISENADTVSLPDAELYASKVCVWFMLNGKAENGIKWRFSLRLPSLCLKVCTKYIHFYMCTS